MSLLLALSPVRLYLRNSVLNGQTRGGTALFDLLTVAGSSTDTAVVNTTIAGTEIQFTKTAGGSPVAFISPRFDANYTVTGADLAAWFAESSALVNAGARVRLYRWRAGAETEFTGSPADDGVEFTTTAALNTWLSSLTALDFLTDDRLLLVPYVVNVGAMTMGTATLYFNGAVGAGGSPTYALVQTASGTAGAGVATVTLTSAPTVGNIMFAQYFSRAVTQTPPAGWTLAVNQNNPIEADNVSIYYRIVQSGDGTTYVWGNGTDAELVTITEFSCSTGWPSNPVNATGSTARTTAVSSLSSGTTGATTQAAAVSIGAVGLRNVFANTPSWTNSFTSQGIVGGGVTVNTLMGAYKIESTTGTKESTVTWLGGAETAMGAIAVFIGNLTPAADSYADIYPALTFKAESGGAYTLTALTGAYALAGQSAVLNKSELITANAGAYTYAGISAVLRKSRLLTAQTGSYVLAGQSATLNKSKTIVANTGGYVYVGNSAVLTYTTGATAYSLTALTGNYTFAGNAATLTKSKLINANVGAYTYTGIAATLTRSKRLVAQTGSYTVSGQSSILTRNKRIVASTGNYSLAGNSAILTYTPLAGVYTLTCLTGAYVYAGNAANLTYVGNAQQGAGHGSNEARKRFYVDDVPYDVPISSIDYFLSNLPKLAEKEPEKIAIQSVKKTGEVARAQVLVKTHAYEAFKDLVATQIQIPSFDYQAIYEFEQNTLNQLALLAALELKAQNEYKLKYKARLLALLLD